MESPACDSCRFFRADSSRRFGTCRHPKHQHTGIEITVRARELHCYRGFGIDDWMPRLIGEATEPQDLLVSERPAPMRAPWREIPLHEVPDAPAHAIPD